MPHALVVKNMRPSPARSAATGRCARGRLRDGGPVASDPVAAAKQENPSAPVPIDLVTASASGLDPEISPAAALFQVPRVARERKVSEDEIRQVVAANTQGRQWGFLGEPRVNVLLLNLALDDRWPATGATAQ